MKKRRVYEALIQKSSISEQRTGDCRGRGKISDCKKWYSRSEGKILCKQNTKRESGRKAFWKFLKNHLWRQENLCAAFSLPVEAVCTRRCLTRNR